MNGFSASNELTHQRVFLSVSTAQADHSGIDLPTCSHSNE